MHPGRHIELDRVKELGTRWQKHFRRKFHTSAANLKIAMMFCHVSITIITLLTSAAVCLLVAGKLCLKVQRRIILRDILRGILVKFKMMWKSETSVSFMIFSSNKLKYNPRQRNGFVLSVDDSTLAMSWALGGEIYI